MSKGAVVVIGYKKYTVKKHVTDCYGMVMYALLKRYRGRNAANICSDIMADCVYRKSYKSWEDFTDYLCTAAYGRLCKYRKALVQGKTNNTEKAISDVGMLRNAWSKYSEIPGLVEYFTKYEIADYLGKSLEGGYKDMNREEVKLLKGMIRVYRKLSKGEVKKLQGDIYTVTMQKYHSIQ